jgi:hypothetical protein
MSAETPSTLLWARPSSRSWTEPCELAVCMLPAVPHCAAAQTRRCLRAGHRAEPVAGSCRCHHRRALFLALQWCRSFVSTSVAELRFAADTHTLSTPPSSEGPTFLWPGVV